MPRGSQRRQRQSRSVVNITAPNPLQKEMALAAIAAGGHVDCEKLHLAQRTPRPV